MKTVPSFKTRRAGTRSPFEEVLENLCCWTQTATDRVRTSKHGQENTKAEHHTRAPQSRAVAAPHGSEERHPRSSQGRKVFGRMHLKPGWRPDPSAPFLPSIIMAARAARAGLAIGGRLGTCVRCLATPASPLKGMDILMANQFERSNIDLYHVMKVAAAMEQLVARQGGNDVLKGKNLITLFMEPSTRTASSFQKAMLRLGGTINESVSSAKKRRDLRGHAARAGAICRRNCDPSSANRRRKARGKCHLRSRPQCRRRRVRAPTQGCWIASS